MKLKLKNNLSLILIAFVAAIALHLAAVCYAQAKECGQKAPDDDFLLEITRKGTGMIFPLKQQVYFRLYVSGRLEFEVPAEFNPDAERANWELVKRESQLSSESVKELVEIMERSCFSNAAASYPALESDIDAVMVTTVTYRHGNHMKQIVVRNYRPEHPRGRDYYPACLRTLLQKVVELRPKTNEEVQYKWDTIY